MCLYTISINSEQWGKYLTVYRVAIRRSDFYLNEGAVIYGTPTVPGSGYTLTTFSSLIFIAILRPVHVFFCNSLPESPESLYSGAWSPVWWRDLKEVKAAKSFGGCWKDSWSCVELHVGAPEGYCKRRMFGLCTRPVSTQPLTLTNSPAMVPSPRTLPPGPGREGPYCTSV